MTTYTVNSHDNERNTIQSEVRVQAVDRQCLVTSSQSSFSVYEATTTTTTTTWRHRLVHWSMGQPITTENQYSPMHFAQVCSWWFHTQRQAARHTVSRGSVQADILPLIISRLLACQSHSRSCDPGCFPPPPPSSLALLRYLTKPFIATLPQSYMAYIKLYQTVACAALDVLFRSLQFNQSDFLHTWQISHPYHMEEDWQITSLSLVITVLVASCGDSLHHQASFCFCQFLAGRKPWTDCVLIRVCLRMCFREHASLGRWSAALKVTASPVPAELFVLLMLFFLKRCY